MDLDHPQQDAAAVETCVTSPEVQAAQFMMKLDAHSPPPVFTVVMIVVNAAIFAAMFIGGVNVEHPTVQSLINWGANYGPKTSTAHQWWRLFSSIFVHANLFHIGFNMFVLWKIGSFIETLIGHRSFLIAYFCAGIAGGFVSLLSHPYISSVGASGAIFGLYGVLIAILWLRGDAIPTEVLSPLTKSTLLFVGYNLVFGLINRGTDLAAHIGGLLAGFFCGLVMSRPLTFEESPASGVRQAVTAAGAALLFVATGVALPHYVDIVSEISGFGAVEKTALAAYNGAFAKARAHQLNDVQLGDYIEQDVLPPWNAERVKLGRLSGLPEKQQAVIALIEEYMDARQQAWTQIAAGLRQHDRAAVMKGSTQQMEAMKVLARLRALPH